MVANLKSVTDISCDSFKSRLPIVFVLGLGLLAMVPAWSDAADGEKTQRSAATDVLTGVQRRIAKEPKYVSSPKYALLVLGTSAESQVWMVEDGKTLYVDRNANGDLTDDGPPIEPTNVRTFGRLPSGNPKRDFDYVLDEIKLPNGTRHTNFRLARWNYGDDQDEYGLRLMLDGKTLMYAGWTPFWGKSVQSAPIIHFGGPVKIRLLRYKEFVLNSGTGRISIAFINPGRGEGAHSRLSFEALPEEAIPIVEIDWPVAAGAAPVRTMHRLTERCCYWEFYDRGFSVPKAAVAGTATLKVSFSGGKLPFELWPDTVKIPVRAGDSVSAK